MRRIRRAGRRWRRQLAQTRRLPGPGVRSVGPPPGFESLLKPQTTLVDVVFGDKVLGQVLATFRPGRLRFHEPAKVAALIPGVKDPKAVTGALTGELKTNPDRVCSTPPQPGCGRLAPAVAGTIFDESKFRANVFVHPSLLATTPAVSRKFLPTPQTGLSFIQILGGATEGTSETSPEYNFRGRSILGYRDSRLWADLSFSSKDDFLADQLFGELDKPGWQYRGGIFRSEGTSLLSQQKILGVSIGTSTDMRLDIDQAYGSQLVIFLPRRATVSILRDGRLLASRTYEAGNQTLDTRRLPNGAYPVTLRIREAGGAVREERRFFVKTTNLPPADQPLYLAQVGVIADDRNRAFAIPTSRLFYRLGAARRITDWLALGADILGTERQAIVEPNLFLFRRSLNLRVAGLASTEGDFGVSVSAYGTFKDFGYSVNFRRIWSPDSLPPTSLLAPGDFDPITRSFTQLNGSLTYRIGTARIGFVGTWRMADGEPDSYSFGPTLFWPLWRNRLFTVTLIGQATRSNTATAAFARLRIRFHHRKWTLIGDAGARYTDTRTTPANGLDGIRAIGRASATYVEPNILGQELTLQGFADRDDTTVAGGEALVRGSLGQFRASGEHVIEGPERLTRYTGGFIIGGAVNAKGVALGGRDSYNSAVIVKVRGLVGDAGFTVLVDGSPKGRVRANRDLVLFLPPYEQYKIRLRLRRGAMVNFDANARTVTLLPGTVQTLTWRASPVVAVFGQALRPDGSPVANATIKGVIGIGLTDDLGFFQVEVGARRTLTFEQPGGKQCKVSLANMTPRNGYASVGRLTCR